MKRRDKKKQDKLQKITLKRALYEKARKRTIKLKKQKAIESRASLADS